MIGVAKLDIRIYEEVEADSHATGQALGVVLLSSLAAGSGAAALGVGVITSMVVAVLSWVIWAFLTYVIGTRLLPEPQTHADMGQLMRTLGFAQAPGVLRIFGGLPGIGPIVLGVVLGVDVGRHGDCRASSAGFHDHVARGSGLSPGVAGRHHSDSPAPRPDGSAHRRLTWRQAR